MRFFSVIATAFALAVPAVMASTAASPVTLTSQFSLLYGKSNHYGAPIPHGKPECHPGWYYGDKPDDLKDILLWLKNDFLCFILDLISINCLHCPGHGGHHGDGWSSTFNNYTCAVQASDYLTYGLVDTVDDCKTMCETVDDCVFFNTFHDNNAKDGSTQLTCSLFSKCHDITAADNCGGQSQPDGSISFITESTGYCKK